MDVAAHFAKSDPQVRQTYLGSWMQRVPSDGLSKSRRRRPSTWWRGRRRGIATRRTALILTLKSAKALRSPRIEKRQQVSAHRWHMEIRLTKSSGPRCRTSVRT